MSWLWLAADPLFEQPVRQLRVDAASPILHLQHQILPQIAQGNPDGLIGRTVAAGRLEGVVDEVAQHRYQLGTADTGRNVVQTGIGIDHELKTEFVGPVVFAEQQPRHLGFGDGPHQEAEQGLLGGRLPPDEGERLPGGPELQ